MDGEAVSYRECSYLRGHVGRVVALLALKEAEGAFSGGLLVSGGADSSIRVWNPRVREGDNACVQIVYGHEGTVTALAQVQPGS
jgi:WD40 repeat protein